ncbi:MAG TPA: hypothetical protein EYP33_06325, partial [Pyrodictium sp.]|nr:hypothetical protein [Pyrodictium sp.]
MYPAKSFSTTFAIADVLANRVPGVCAVSLLALVPDTLYIARLAASGGVEEALQQLCGSIPSSSCRAPRSRVVAESLNTLLQILDDKAEEYGKQLGYGERVLEAMQSLIHQKAKGYRHGELHVQGTRVDGRIYLDVDAYPLLVTQPVLEKSDKRYLVMHSIQETLRRLFFEWMRGVIASRVLGFLLEAEKTQSKPIDVVVVDTTYGLNYATLAGLDAARTATALYALAQHASGRREDIVLEVVNSDPYPIFPNKAQEEAKKTGWSLKVHIVTRQVMTLQAVYSILSSAYSNVDEIDSYLKKLLPDQPARRLLASAAAAAAAGAAAWTVVAAKLADSLLDRLLVLANALGLGRSRGIGLGDTHA